MQVRDESRLGIRFFKDLPRDVRNEIGKYLSRKDKYMISAV